MTEKTDEFVNQLRDEWPKARVEADEFPSGAVYVDVYCTGRHFLMRYFPSGDYFGVDEVLPDEGFSQKYAFTTSSKNEAAQHLREIVKQAMCLANGTAETASARPSKV